MLLFCFGVSDSKKANEYDGSIQVFMTCDFVRDGVLQSDEQSGDVIVALCGNWCCRVLCWTIERSMCND